jgi:predicted permease
MSGPTGRHPVPSLPIRLIGWSVAPTEREYIVGDLVEEFELRAEGDPGAAALWLWRQAFASIAPNLRRRLARRAPPVPTNRGAPMHGMLADVRFSARLLRQQPLLAIVALASLMVGLGLNVVLFTVANAVLYRPLPVRDPKSLALLGMQRPTNVAQNFPYWAYQTLAEHSNVFEALTAYASRSAALRFDDETTSANGELVSGTFFTGLGVPMTLGRGLTPEDDRAAAPPAVVVSASLWRRRFGGAPLWGQTLTVNGTAFTIVGVADDEFRGMFTGAQSDFWIPLAHSTIVNGQDLLSRRTASWLFLLGRLRPGVTTDAARNALDPALAAMFRSVGADPEPLVVSSGMRGSDTLTPRLARPLQLLMLAGGFVLLVACVNVANLQLARNAARRRELAVRAALGAGQARLARLLLIDAVILVVPACALALAVAWWAREPALGLITRFGQPVELAAPIDMRVLLYACAAAAAAALFVGILSAWQAARPSPTALTDGGRGDTGSRYRVQRTLVVVQFALSMTLLVGAALLVRSVSNLRNTDLGFATNVVMVEVAPGDAQLTGQSAVQYVEQAIARAAAVPGVESAAVAHVVPLDFGGSRMTVRIPGYSPQRDEDMELNFLRVTPGYFETMRIPLLRGRTFHAADVPGAPIRVVVNETMARRYWPGGDAVGRPIGVLGGQGPAGEVVGVVADVHYRMVREEPRPSFYLSFTQSPFPQAVIHARTHGDPSAFVETLRRTVSEVNSQVPVSRAHSLDEQMLRNIADDRMAQAIAVVLGASALLLAAVGLYGTMAFSVRRRTREIGVRLALGAPIAEVRRLVVRQGLALVALGAAAGAMGSVMVGRLLANQLYGVSPTDPLSVVSALAILIAIAWLATWLPARKATGIDPAEALRE